MSSDGVLQRLTVLAATFRDLPTAGREELATRLLEPEIRLAEHVVIHTCHRVELVAVAEAGETVPEPPGMRRFRGAEAVERVLMVAGGFDSAVLGEEHLLGQVRDAYGAALARRQTGPVLNELFRRALRFGKQVRAAAIPGLSRSVAAQAVSIALDRLKRRGVRGTVQALVIGTGEAARTAAGALDAAGAACTVASRSIDRATAAVAGLPGAGRHRSIDLRHALDANARFNLIVVATRTSEPIVERRHVSTPPPLLVDLSAPPGIASDIRGDPSVELIDLDSLADVERSPALRAADERRLRARLADERERFVAWLGHQGAGDGVALLRDHAAALRTAHLERLRTRGDLTDSQFAAVERMTSSLVAELLHLPTVHLRRDPAAAERVRELFGLGR